MALEQERLESANVTSPMDMVAIEGVQTEDLPKLPPANQPESQWQQISHKVALFLERLPLYLNRFFDAYQQPLIAFALFLAAIVTIKVVLAVLNALNGIPLLEPIFTLIGIIYSTWFVFRYLLKASTRQELFAEIRFLKAQILGEQA
jgi:CAAD domains of cyanobacterial aminoacyl-tRNA synthetase